ncbi:MAG: UvrB/UvrC motif-containing protein [Clostridia bacterium]|nr:UvrB/UvrC motif-containing protein [Clostridia bacterium]
MMCDECGIRPANIRITTIVNGEKKDRNLCSECLANSQRYKHDFSTLAGHLNGLLDALKSGGSKKEEPIPDITCSRCGTTYEKYRKSGMVGCAQCYSDFREPLQTAISRIHGHTQHVGRMPGGIDKKLSMKLKLDKLRQELANAISAEEYENAAALRDQIRALSAQISTEVAEND